MTYQSATSTTEPQETMWARLSAWIAASVPRAGFIVVVVLVCMTDIEQLEAIFAMGNYLHMFLLPAILAGLFGLLLALLHGGRRLLVRGWWQLAVDVLVCLLTVAPFAFAAKRGNPDWSSLSLWAVAILLSLGGGAIMYVLKPSTAADSDGTPQKMTVTSAADTRIMAQPLSESLIVTGITVVTLAAWVILITLALFHPIGTGEALGTVAIVVLFAGLLSVSIRLILMAGPVPALAMLFGGLAVLLFHEEEHQMRMALPMPAAAELAAGPELPYDAVVKSTLADWLATRNDLAVYADRGRPYPVFILAAAGGGGYAAAHTFLLQESLRQRCPNFAQHLFAAAGVSGGAVGNAMVFVRLGPGDNPESFLGCDGGTEISTESIELLSHDYLSPVAFTLLFHDFPDRLLFGLLPGDDRIAVFRKALQRKLCFEDEPQQGRCMESPHNGVLSHFWAAEGDSWTARGNTMLIAIATTVETGSPYVMGPLHLSSRESLEARILGQQRRSLFEDLQRAGRLYGPVDDIPLLEAALASAAFPYINSSVKLALDYRGSGQNLETVLVDGGYYDGSGVATILDVFRDQQLLSHKRTRAMASAQATQIAALLPERFDDCETIVVATAAEWQSGPGSQGWNCEVPVAVHVIGLAAKEGESDLANDPGYLRAEKDKSFGEKQNFLLDPLYAMARARGSRAYGPRADMLSEMCARSTEAGQECTLAALDSYRVSGRYIHFDLDKSSANLPLGWYMPKRVVSELSTNALPRSKIPANGTGISSYSAFSERNALAAHQVAEALSP